MPKIVKFTNGKYAVRQWRLLMPSQYLALGGNDWFVAEENVSRYCLFDTEAAARDCYNRHLSKEKEAKLKVEKTIKI